MGEKSSRIDRSFHSDYCFGVVLISVSSVTKFTCQSVTILKGCYDQKNIYDARRIYDEYFKPNLDRFFNSSDTFRKDLAIIFMFTRIVKEYEYYRDIAKNMLGVGTYFKRLSPYCELTKMKGFNPVTMFFYNERGKISVITVRGSHIIGDWYTNLNQRKDIDYSLLDEITRNADKSMKDKYDVLRTKCNMLTTTVHNGSQWYASTCLRVLSFYPWDTQN